MTGIDFLIMCIR